MARSSLERLLAQVVVAHRELAAAHGGRGDPFRLRDHLPRRPDASPNAGS